MAIMDPIADLFTRIRNAIQEKHSEVEIPHSNMKTSICDILKAEGYIQDYAVMNNDLVKKKIKIKLKYRRNGLPVIQEIKRVSKSSKRIYVPKSNIPKVKNGFGTCIVSTSKGVLSGRDARLKNVGGELIGIIT